MSAWEREGGDWEGQGREGSYRIRRWEITVVVKNIYVCQSFEAFSFLSLLHIEMSSTFYRYVSPVSHFSSIHRIKRSI